MKTDLTHEEWEVVAKAVRHRWGSLWGRNILNPETGVRRGESDVVPISNIGVIETVLDALASLGPNADEERQARFEDLTAMTVVPAVLPPPPRQRP